jgi:uncharacterized membrane protein
MNRLLFYCRSGLFVAGCLIALTSTVEAAEAAAEAEAFDWRAFLAPFHTVTLHMPIGFVVMAVILEAYSFFRPSEPLRRAIGLVLFFSALSAVVVVLLGIFRASGGGYEPEMLEEHRRYGIAVGAVTALVLLMHWIAFRREAKKVPAGLYRVLLLADAVLLVVAGHGGGNLTHGSKYLTENAPAWVKEWVDPDGASGEGEETIPGGGVFADVIQPIFEEKCYQCHGEEKQKGDYRMDTAEGLFAAGESELDPIVKGIATESYLVEVITLPEDDDLVMPPEGKERLTPEETLAVIQWIWNGAEMK